MSRTIAAGVLGLIGFAISPPCFGQAPSGPSRDRRLEAAETDISLLKRLVKEQDRRIAELEKTVKSLQAPPAVVNEKPTAAVNEKPTAHAIAKTIFKPSAPWQNPLAWAQIQKGLSRAQVEEILGAPTSVESVIDSQTLFYKGDVPGSGAAAGVIKLTDDRVSEITPPVF
jgi:hypothetical protein